MVRLFLLSGFNPFNKDEWRIDQYYKHAVSPRINNWTREDVEYAIYWYTMKYSGDPFIISCHSDGGTVAHTIAHTDERCIGLHCHAAMCVKEKKVRDIPILFTHNFWDFTSMGLATRRAYRYYHKLLGSKVEKETLKRMTCLGHSYEPAVPIFSEWCQRNFNFTPELA